MKIIFYVIFLVFSLIGCSELKGDSSTSLNAGNETPNSILKDNGNSVEMYTRLSFREANIDGCVFYISDMVSTHQTNEYRLSSTFTISNELNNVSYDNDSSNCSLLEDEFNVVVDGSVYDESELTYDLVLSDVENNAVRVEYQLYYDDKVLLSYSGLSDIVRLNNN